MAPELNAKTLSARHSFNAASCALAGCWTYYVSWVGIITPSFSAIGCLMARSLRMQNKLHSLYLIDVGIALLDDDNLVNKLWTLRQGEWLDLNATTLTCEPLQKYRLEYMVTRGPIPGHWAYRPFDPTELNLMFTAKHCDDIAHAWTLDRL
ncbi:hypothetical protein [Pseudomonas farsensis]|uniref:Uncharacterized protein n=1 Tax=Pseudomonas farsensis TaxID=2745492 RepID=A0ABU8QNR5_9PSED